MQQADRGRVVEFEKLYRENLESVVRYVSRRCGTSDAVDIVAETFTVAWRRFDEIADKENAAPWLYGVARRTLSNHRRMSRRRIALGERIYQEWIPNEAAAAPFRLQPLSIALLKLSEAEREILILTGAEELSPAEISVVLDISPGAARTRLSRARSRLEEVLSKSDIDEINSTANEGRTTHDL